MGGMETDAQPALSAAAQRCAEPDDLPRPVPHALPAVSHLGRAVSGRLHDPNPGKASAVAVPSNGKMARGRFVLRCTGRRHGADAPQLCRRRPDICRCQNRDAALRGPDLSVCFTPDRTAERERGACAAVFRLRGKHARRYAGRVAVSRGGACGLPCAERADDRF